jgi:hypothetical protein
VLQLNLSGEAQPVGQARTTGFTKEGSTLHHERVEPIIFARLLRDVPHSKQRQPDRLCRPEAPQNGEAFLLVASCSLLVTVGQGPPPDETKQQTGE